MSVNQGLAMFVADTFASHYKLDEMTFGLLGIAFKANNDDTRSSLSDKLKKPLSFRAKTVLTTDLYVTTDPTLLTLETAISRSDILVLYAAHKTSRVLQLDGKIVVIWNLWGLKPNIAVAEA